MTRSAAEVVLQRGSYSKRSGGSGQDALASAGSCLNWGKNRLREHFINAGVNTGSKKKRVLRVFV